MSEPYTIKLQGNGFPYALFTSRMILLPLLVEVEQKIAKIESQGVIYKVNQPTPLCAGMVAVPKKSSAIQICVDLK